MFPRCHSWGLPNPTGGSSHHMPCGAVGSRDQRSAVYFLGRTGDAVDPKHIESRVVDFAYKLLEEAHGDPVRALGLLVLVLDGLEEYDAQQYTQLVSDIRIVLMPDFRRRAPVVQHLAGEMSWEGHQHCLRCGMALVKGRLTDREGFPAGHVYQVGVHLSLESPDDYELCGS